MRIALFWFAVVCLLALTGVKVIAQGGQNGQRIHQLTDEQLYKVYDQGRMQGQKDVIDYLGPARCIPSIS